MGEHGPVDVVSGIDVDATHELDELARLRQVVALRLVDGLADQVQSHPLTFPCFRYGKVRIHGDRKDEKSDLRVLSVRDSFFRHPKRTDPTTGEEGLRVRQSLKTASAFAYPGFRESRT